MALIEEITALETKENKLANNRVANFCYEDSAYDNDDANGVSSYVYANAQNIPLASNEIIKLDPVVTNKGFRSQASSLPRMAVNHFFGRVSYNLNKTVDVLKSFMTSVKNSLGAADGIATLDSDGRIPFSQLPESAIEFKGTWDASTNTPHLEEHIGRNGDFYIVDVAGVQFGENFYVNDRIIYNGATSTWKRLEGNVNKVPVGFIYQQIYNPIQGTWEASPETMYPANTWQDISDDFEDSPYLRIGQYGEGSTLALHGEGHNAAHNHAMAHKHRMEHSHNADHRHWCKSTIYYGSAASSGSGGSYPAMISNANNRGSRELGGWSTNMRKIGEDVEITTTGVSSYANGFTGGAATPASTTSSTVAQDNTAGSGSGLYPEPNWTGMRLWKCIG